MTLAWVESQIEKTMSQGNSPQAVYDLAALVTVRTYLLEEAKKNTAPAGAGKRDVVTLTAYSADLHKVPTLDQVEAALNAVAITTPEEKQRALDARTWAGIIRGKT